MGPLKGGDKRVYKYVIFKKVIVFNLYKCNGEVKWMMVDGLKMLGHRQSLEKKMVVLLLGLGGPFWVVMFQKVITTCFSILLNHY